MTKIQKTALFGLPVLVGIYLIYRQFRKPKPIGRYIPPSTPEPVVTSTNVNTNSTCKYPLKKGVYNCVLVKKVQWALNHIPATSYNTTTNLVKYRPLVEDGDFGAKTEAVLKDFWGDGTVQNETEMNNLMSYIVADPAAFQEAENPYIVAPTPTPTFDWTPF